MIYGYARVSTKGQDKYGNSLPAQEAQLKAAGAEVIYHDSFTGTKMDRPAFTELINLLKAGDTLVVCKLDRFARTTTGGVQMVQDLVNRGVKINVLNMGTVENTPIGKVMLTVMFAFAELERDLIVERTQVGKAIARETKPGWREGRQKKEPEELREMIAKVDSGVMSVQEACEALGISRSTWVRRRRDAA